MKKKNHDKNNTYWFDRVEKKFVFKSHLLQMRQIVVSKIDRFADVRIKGSVVLVTYKGNVVKLQTHC